MDGLLQEQFNSKNTRKPIQLYVDTSGIPTAAGAAAVGVEGQCTQFSLYDLHILTSK